MVKTKTKVKISFAGILSIVAGICVGVISRPEVSADTYWKSFRVNVLESLSVSIEQPVESATGNINTFLRNKVSVKVSTNNANGYTASMYSHSSTNLINAADNSYIIPTLENNSSRSSFPANYWGYSFNDTDSGDGSSTYSAMKTIAEPIIIGSSESQAADDPSDIYFGTKADASKGAGTYKNNIIISVISGTVDEDVPYEPSNEDDKTHYEETNRTHTSSNGETETTTTTIIGGEYTGPLGVSENTSSSISTGSSLATGLAVASATAAISGLLFFILAKRRKDDEEDEEDLYL